MAGRELSSTTLFNDANLVSYYKLENVNDSKGSNTLTNNNTVAFNPAMFNNGADGGAANTNKSLSVANKLSYANGAYSIVMWVKLTTEITVGTYKFCELVDSTSKTSLVLDYNFNGGTRQLEAFHLRAGVASENAQFNTALGISAFHHLGLVNDTVNVLLYLDGTQVASVAFNNGTGSTAISDGMFLLCDRASTNFTSGILDDAGFFSRALSASEMTLLNSAPPGGLLLSDI